MSAQTKLNWQGDYVQGSFITFIRTGNSGSGKTQVWTVRAALNEELGRVKWFGRWRTYTFDAEPNTVYEKTCLREIAQFCDELTKEHNQRRKNRREFLTLKPIKEGTRVSR